MSSSYVDSRFHWAWNEESKSYISNKNNFTCSVKPIKKSCWQATLSQSGKTLISWPDYSTNPPSASLTDCMKWFRQLIALSETE